MVSTKKLNSLKKLLDVARLQHLSKSTVSAIKKRKLKLGDKVRLNKKSTAFDRNINNLFNMNTIGGVIKDTNGLQSAIQFYLVGQGTYKYAKIIDFNNDASGQTKPITGVHLEFYFNDGSKMTTWYYLRDVVKTK